jgi:hypothetical protein
MKQNSIWTNIDSDINLSIFDADHQFFGLDALTTISAEVFHETTKTSHG